MKRTITLLAAFGLLAIGCHRGAQPPSHDELIQAIDSIERPLMQAAQLESVDTAKGHQIIGLYVQFADLFPDDSLAPTYLHRAAQVSNGMEEIDNMTALYDRVINNYPEYEHLDECFYEKGLALDNAGRKDEARTAYQQFLDEYPDHFLADDIRKAVQLLDMSDELLLEFLSGDGQ